VESRRRRGALQVSAALKQHLDASPRDVGVVGAAVRQRGHHLPWQRADDRACAALPAHVVHIGAGVDGDRHDIRSLWRASVAHEEVAKERLAVLARAERRNRAFRRAEARVDQRPAIAVEQVLVRAAEADRTDAFQTYRVRNPESPACACEQRVGVVATIGRHFKSAAGRRAVNLRGFPREVRGPAGVSDTHLQLVLLARRVEVVARRLNRDGLHRDPLQVGVIARCACSSHAARAYTPRA
jgi:hypothetical protein